MDLTESLAPKSTQMDYEDFLGGPRTFTVQEVRQGPSAEQPVEIVMAEFDRPWRPAKTVRRVLVACWGADGAQYVGRRLTLYGDPKVRFGGAEVGGIRLSHASHIDSPVTVTAMVTRGKRAPFTVQPLTERANPNDEVIQRAVPKIAAATTVEELDELEKLARTRGIHTAPRVAEAFLVARERLGFTRASIAVKEPGDG